MEEMTEGWPVWVVFVVLFLGAFIRGNATYWVGRAIRSGGARSRFATLLDRGEPIPMFGDGTTRRDYTYVADVVR